MVDDRASVASGYLHIDGVGGIRAREIQGLLQALEDAYQAVSRVEVTALSSLSIANWIERYGPPFRYAPPGWASLPAAGAVVSSPLIVAKVELASPGFWEFFGTLNPLEVMRKYLNDRHERSKDKEYRSAAERERLELENDSLALDNAVKSIEAVDRLCRLEREFGPRGYAAEAWQRTMGAELREPLGRLADFDRRGVIEGGTAETRPGQLEPPSAPESSTEVD